MLLGLKKRGFGKGRWNGFGGKVGEKERIEQAMRREVTEECGVQIKNFRKRGVLEFEFKGEPEILEVHIFSADQFEGEPFESEEMKPRWFRHNEIPFDDMWPDDKLWLPILLAGKNFRGRFVFQGQDRILEYKLKEKMANSR